MTRVRLDHLRVAFGDVVAVDDVSITFDDGEFVVLLGPSGCGKTTTLRCIAGLEQPTAGEIYFGDDAVSTLPSRTRNVAMVFQFVSLYPHLNVRDNIAFPLRARGEGRKEIDRRIDWMTRIFALDDILYRKPGVLPPGARQKAALARAVVRDPRVLLLDEPLSAIDEQFREEMRWELRHIQKELGTTTIHVTHDQREAMSLADRVVLMRDGQIVQAGTPAALYDDPANEFAAFFIGSPSINLIDAEITDQGLLLGAEQVPLTLPLAHLAALRAAALPRCRIGVRPYALSPATGSADSPLLARAEMLERYPLERETFFDCRIAGQIWKGVVPPGTESLGDGSVRLAADKVFYFAPDGARLRVS